MVGDISMVTCIVTICWYIADDRYKKNTWKAIQNHFWIVVMHQGWSLHILSMSIIEQSYVLWAPKNIWGNTNKASPSKEDDKYLTLRTSLMSKSFVVKPSLIICQFQCYTNTQAWIRMKSWTGRRRSIARQYHA